MMLLKTRPASFLKTVRVCLTHGGLSVDASVGFPQSLDDLQGVEQLVRTFDPQQFLPAETLAILHKKKETNTFTQTCFLRCFLNVTAIKTSCFLGCLCPSRNRPCRLRCSGRPAASWDTSAEASAAPKPAATGSLRGGEAPHTEHSAHKHTQSHSIM